MRDLTPEVTCTARPARTAMSEHPRSDEKRAGDRRVPLGFANLYASPGDHIGHFYQTTAEWRNLLTAYFMVGLNADEKCVYINPGPEVQDLLDVLAGSGIDVQGAIASRQLVLDAGKDEPEKMQAMLESELAEIDQKFPFLRWAGNMTWSLEKMPTSETLMTWESHCNVLDDPSAIFLCQYDLSKFRGSVVMDALKTHPLCIVNNVIHQNPFYEDPESFLEELRGRAPTALAD